MSSHRSRSTSLGLPLALALLLAGAAACGGNGGGGTSQAVIEEANQQDLANAAAEAALWGAGSSELEDIEVILPFAIGTPPARALGDEAPPVSLGIPDEDCALGGRVRFTDLDESGNTVSGTIRFDECDEGDFFADGRIRFTVNVSSENATLRVRDLFFSGGGESATLVRFDLQCSAFLSFPECTPIEPPVIGVVGFDQREYEVDLRDATVTCNGTCSVLGGRVTDPDHGRIDFDAVGMAFDCPNGRPSAGTIRMEGRRGTAADIGFPSCDGYEVCRDRTEEELAEEGLPVPQECDTFAWPAAPMAG